MCCNEKIYQRTLVNHCCACLYRIFDPLFKGSPPYLGNSDYGIEDIFAFVIRNPEYSANTTSTSYIVRHVLSEDSETETIFGQLEASYLCADPYRQSLANTAVKYVNRAYALTRFNFTYLTFQGARAVALNC